MCRMVNVNDPVTSAKVAKGSRGLTLPSWLVLLSTASVTTKPPFNPVCSGPPQPRKVIYQAVAISDSIIDAQSPGI